MGFVSLFVRLLREEKLEAFEMKKIVVLGLVCLIAGAAHAVLIAWENFDYDTGALGATTEAAGGQAHGAEATMRTFSSPARPCPIVAATWS